MSKPKPRKRVHFQEPIFRNWAPKPTKGHIATEIGAHSEFRIELEGSKLAEDPVSREITNPPTMQLELVRRREPCANAFCGPGQFDYSVLRMRKNF